MAASLQWLDSYVDSVKPEQPDIYANYRRISVMRFVREREIGVRGTIPPRMNIKFCDDISQWSQRVYKVCESSMCPQVHEQAENRIAQYCSHILRCQNSRKPSLLIDLVLERAAFIEVVLFKDIRLPSPVATISEYYKHHVESDFAKFLFERTSYMELMNILMRSIRLGDDDADELFTKFVAHMREQ